MKNYLVDENGYYGEFGGAFVPEILHRCVDELRQSYPTVAKYGLKAVMLITPETSEERIREIDANTDGFISFRTACEWSSGAIVGSRFVTLLDEHEGNAEEAVLALKHDLGLS